MPDSLTQRQSTRIPRKRILLFWLSGLLCLGFLSTTLISYQVSKRSIRESILTQELPLTSDNVYSEILKDLVRPIFVSSMMASDTFLRDWAMQGERNVDEIVRYLREVMGKYGAFTSFFISDKTRAYYHPSGVIKKVNELESRDAWYFRVRNMAEPYEINVDPDMANRDLLTIFINYRVLDFGGRFLGVAGVGLKVESVRKAIEVYQERFGRSIYFVDRQGRIVLSSARVGGGETNIHFIPGLREQATQIIDKGSGSFQYENNGQEHLLNVRYIPELKWLLFVEKTEDEALTGIRRTLFVNLAVCLAVTILVVGITGLALRRYQNRLEELATTDKLTGLLNRQALDVLFPQTMSHAQRVGSPLSVVLADIDRFKEVNDRLGHLVGDEVLKRAAANLRGQLRASDSVCRWGGEEFLILLKDCDAAQAQILAEKLRTEMEADPLLSALAREPVTISLGVAQLADGESEDRLVGRADAAMYAAKEAGRNCVRLG